MRSLSFLNSQLVNLNKKNCPTSTRIKYKIRLPNCHKLCSFCMAFSLSTTTCLLLAASWSPGTVFPQSILIGKGNDDLFAIHQVCNNIRTL